MKSRLMKACGLVVYRSRPYTVFTDSPLLIFDAEAWVRWAASWHDVEAVHADADGDLDCGNDFRLMAHRLHTWLEADTEQERYDALQQLDAPLRLRLAFTPHVVDRASLTPYLCKVMSMSETPGEDQRPNFLLHADGSPKLYAIHRLRAQLTHTGPAVTGIAVTEDELRRGVAEMCRHAGDTALIPRGFLGD